MNHLANAASLLIDIFFGLAAVLFVLRLALQWVGAPFHNPLCQAIYRMSNPVLMPLRRVLKPWRKIDLAAALVAYLVMCGKAALMLAIWSIPLGMAAIALLGLAELLGLVITLWFWLILIVVILSWVGRGASHPAIPLLTRLTEPVLAPFRRLLPKPGGIDLSPMLVVLLLLLARILIVAPLQELALGFSQA